MASPQIPLDQFFDQQKQIIRRLDSLQKSADLLYQHLSILDDIQLTLQTLKSKVEISNNKAEIVNKDLKADLSEVKEKTIDTMEEIVDEIAGAVDLTRV